MRRTILLTALAATLIVAAPASAGWRLDRARQIADTVWHHPCATQGIKIEWPRALDSGWADERDDGEGTVPGGSFDAATCVIYLNPHIRHPWPDLCTEILHETGHLDGYRDPTNATDPLHSSNPRSVMYESVRERTIHHTARGDVVTWDADPRCAHRGRPFLALHAP